MFHFTIPGCLRNLALDHLAERRETAGRVDDHGACLARSFRRQLLDRLAQAGDGAIRGTGFECRWHVHYSLLHDCRWCQIMLQLCAVQLTKLAYGSSQIAVLTASSRLSV